MQRTDGQARIEASAVTNRRAVEQTHSGYETIVHLGDITEAIQHGQVLPGEQLHPEPFLPIDQDREFPLGRHPPTRTSGSRRLTRCPTSTSSSHELLLARLKESPTVQIGTALDDVWWQGGDLNSRPRVYEALARGGQGTPGSHFAQGWGLRRIGSRSP